jgi:hypothetical protein
VGAVDADPLATDAVVLATHGRRKRTGVGGEDLAMDGGRIACCAQWPLT